MKQNPSLTALTSQTGLETEAGNGIVVTKEDRTPADSVSEAPIVMRLDAITPAQIEAFARATRSVHHRFVPATFPTAFRASEFQWLDRLDIDMRQLLHTDQEYEYLEPLRAGDRPVVATRIVEYKERRGMVFVSLQSDVTCNEKLVVIARSSFVVRKGQGESA